MIHFISGKPRGGKSLYAVKLCVEELLYGTRTVITNLPFDLGALNAYLQSKFPERSVDLFKRIIVLTDEETGKFWTIRPNEVRIGVLSEADWRAGRKPDYSAVTDNGVFYAIDEIHNFFNSRAWMETGRDVLFYLSQHGKLGDTVLCITQHIANVDKQFRSVAQDYTYLRNLSKERMGLFRLPARFIRKTYLQPATDNSAAMETGTFSLDVTGLASCYRTAQGVGIHGKSGADKTEKRSGLHWLWFAIGVPVLIVSGIHYGPKWIAKLFTSKPVVKASQPGRVQVSSNAVPAAAAAVPPVPVVRYAPAPVAAAVPAVTMTGLCQTAPGKYSVILSDGRIFRTGDGHLNILADTWCLIDGRRYEFMEPSRPVVQSAVPALPPLSLVGETGALQ